MRALVIGEGLLGCALIEALSEAGHSVTGTSREPLTDKIYLDMTKPIPDLPPVDVVYICAAVASYRQSEGSPQAWAVNADAPVEIVRRCIGQRPSELPAHLYPTMFPVFVSSAAVEYMDTAYTRMKSYAESCIIPMGGAVIRPSKFTAENVASLCHLMIRVGLERKPGVYRWP